MPGHKKTFPCGHRGYGQYCHRCMQEIKQEIEEEKKERERRRRRIEWQKKFADDPINLRHLPKHVVKKARKKIQLLRSGAGFRRLDAKRMQHSRNWIRIKLGNSWRLMARDVGDRIVPVEVLSHEDYNKKYA
jgi:hypothetical protein